MGYRQVDPANLALALVERAAPAAQPRPAVCQGLAHRAELAAAARPRVVSAAHPTLVGAPALVGAAAEDLAVAEALARAQAPRGLAEGLATTS